MTFRLTLNGINCIDTVTTNIGAKFLNIIDQCFPSEHPLRKILNRNTIKVSYSCMPNMEQLISSHNKAILKKATNHTPTNTNSKSCNCRNQPCPLNGNCMTTSVVYQATVKRQDNNKEETYIGLTEGTFKNRFTAHKSDFKNISQRNKTALSKYIWMLKDKKIQYQIRWKILAHAKPYSTSSKRCNLCLTEKFFIIFKPEASSLNERNELASSCRHRRKHLLSNYS